MSKSGSVTKGVSVWSLINRIIKERLRDKSGSFYLELKYIK